MVSRLMYAHGNVESPDDSVVKCMCGLVTTYMKSVIADAKEVASTKGSFDAECFVFALRKDHPKYKAVREILAREEAVSQELSMEL